MQEKTVELNQKRKKLEREFSDKEEALRNSIQKKQILLRERQLGVASELFAKEDWGLVVDKQTPGVLFVSSAIDKTDLVLEAVDEKYQAGKTKKDAPKAATVKTAAATAPTESTTKKTIKVA